MDVALSLRCASARLKVYVAFIQHSVGCLQTPCANVLRTIVQRLAALCWHSHIICDAAPPSTEHSMQLNDAQSGSHVPESPAALPGIGMAACCAPSPCF
jgi:hypothetical protein